MKITDVLNSFLALNGGTLIRNKQSDASTEYETLKVTSPHEYVYHIQLNRPNKRNALNPLAFR